MRRARYWVSQEYNRAAATRYSVPHHRHCDSLFHPCSELVSILDLFASRGKICSEMSRATAADGQMGCIYGWLRMGTGSSLHGFSWAFPDECYERSTQLWFQCARVITTCMVGGCWTWFIHLDRPALPVVRQEMIS